MAERKSTTGTRAVTIKDIARECGVSHVTVSRALRDPEAHHPETSRRILEVAARLGYDPSRHQGARRMVLSRYGKTVLNHLIGLFFPPYFYHTPFFTSLFEGLWDVTTPMGYGLLTVKTDATVLQTLPPSFIRGDVDGAIVTANSETLPRIHAQLREQPSFGQRPIVSLMTALPGCASVSVDAIAGADALMRYLLDLGHTHFLYFQRPNAEPFYSHQDQLAVGYRLALEARRLDPATHLHPLDLDPQLEQYGFNAEHYMEPRIKDELTHMVRHPLLRLLDAHPEITAVLAPNDSTAVIVARLLHDAGRQVPRDISVTGFDDCAPLPDARGRNTLTTVRLPLDEVGRSASRLMIRLVQGETEGEHHLVLPTELVVRRSTAPPKQSGR